MNVTLHIDGNTVTLENLARKAQEVAFTLNGKTYQFRSQRLPGGGYLLERETAPGVWQRVSSSVSQGKDFKRVSLGTLEAKVAEQTKSGGQGHGESALSPRAPMPGLIRQILVKPGEVVSKGHPLLVMEAMKLQTTLSAGGDGTVDAVLVKEGELVTDGAELVKITPAAK